MHPYGNPHIWLDPVNAKQMAANIAAGLSAVDPEHAANYARGLAGFERRLDEALFGKDLVEQVGGKKLARLAEQGRLAAYLEQKELTDLLGGWLAEARPLAGRPLVTYHKTCVYFAARFGLAIQLEIEEKPGIPPSARWRDHVLEVMRREGVHTIAQEVFYDRTAAEYLARETGARVVVFPLDVGPEVDVADYFALIQGILDRLLESERGK